jgi:hypothetical protein
MRASTIPRAWSKSVSEARQQSRWSDDDWGRSSAVTVQSVQLAGMSERLPSGSTTSNNSMPRRLMVPITGNERPSNGCRSRRIVTDLEMSRRQVVCDDFLRHDQPELADPFPGTADRRQAHHPPGPQMAQGGRPGRRGRDDERGGDGAGIGDLAAACQHLPVLTFICGTSRRGGFLVKRKTRRDRMRAKLLEIKMELQRRMHQPIPEQGKWLKQVVAGYFRHFAVPTNIRALKVFRDEVIRRWRQALRRRSQKARMTWTRIAMLADYWLPRPRILHPWPNQRFAVTHPR